MLEEEAIRRPTDETVTSLPEVNIAIAAPTQAAYVPLQTDPPLDRLEVKVVLHGQHIAATLAIRPRPVLRSRRHVFSRPSHEGHTIANTSNISCILFLSPPTKY